MYELAYQRWEKELSGHAKAVLSTAGRLAAGLGNETPLEVGLSLHHTYGTPIVPGSSLRGVAAHYCHEVWGVEGKRAEFRDPGKDPEPTKEDLANAEFGTAYHVLFGASDDGGHVCFEDAWIAPEGLSERGNSAEARSGLVLDVVTTHHPDYYTGDGNAAPTDFDSPNPAPFVSVAGKFLVAVECDVGGEEGKRWQELALELVKQALSEWGVGGKTRAGYGRMRGK